MGQAGPAVARASAAGAPLERPPDGDRRDLVPGPDRLPVAGSAGRVRELEHRLRAASALVAGWDLGQILDRLRAGCDQAEGRDWTVTADSTVVRANQHAAGARRLLAPELVRGAGPNDNNPLAGGPGREALGRSRGGLTTKIRLVADRRCRPLTRILTPGQHADCPQFIPLVGQVRVLRRGAGRPRNRPGSAMGDKAYSSAANRAWLRRRHIRAVIPVKDDQEDHRRARAGAAPARLRPAALQRAQHGRALLFQAQAAPRHRHPL